MKLYSRPTVVWALEELSNQDEQSRLWLSNGSSGEVSSFTEAVCNVFDAGVAVALESGDVPAPIALLFQELGSLIDQIPDNVKPQEILDHPLMCDVRRVSLALLQKLHNE